MYPWADPVKLNAHHHNQLTAQNWQPETSTVRQQGLLYQPYLCLSISGIAPATFAIQLPYLTMKLHPEIKHSISDTTAQITVKLSHHIQIQFLARIWKVLTCILVHYKAHYQATWTKVLHRFCQPFRHIYKPNTFSGPRPLAFKPLPIHPTNFTLLIWYTNNFFT